jgi:hypothetical membrane protein
MYVSGMIVAFVLSFIVFMIQGTKRKKVDTQESTMEVIFGALFGSILASILSWLAVAILILLILSGKAWGISDKNI